MNKTIANADHSYRVLAMFPFFNEENKIKKLVKKLKPNIVNKYIAINDGSTDKGPDILKEHGIEVLDQERSGIGACIKRSINYATINGYDVLVIMAGNNKDDPCEIPRLLDPILNDNADYVQGSRFLPGGSCLNLPSFRKTAIKLLSYLFKIYSKKQCTDITNGFRAYKLSILENQNINIWQNWLDGYEYEYYLHYKVYELGYDVREVPVSKNYPAESYESYTKIQPITGWWCMLRPFILLGLKIKH